METTGNLQEVIVEYLPDPPVSPERKIHPRKESPPVPEGDYTPDPDPSPPAEIDKLKKET